MSIAVELEELRKHIEEFPTDPYLLTVSDDGRAHSVAVTVSWDADELVAPAGRTSRANARARALVALLWPPAQRGAFSLIVDGTVTRVDEAAEHVVVQPTRAVLHRAAASGTGSDCETVL